MGVDCDANDARALRIHPARVSAQMSTFAQFKGSSDVDRVSARTFPGAWDQRFRVRFSLESPVRVT